MRTVIENAAVSYVVDNEQSIYPRLPEAFDSLKWSLAHQPDKGLLLDDENWLYKQAGDEQINIPSLVVVYTFDAVCVILKFILVRLPKL